MLTDLTFDLSCISLVLLIVRNNILGLVEVSDVWRIILQAISRNGYYKKFIELVYSTSKYICGIRKG